MNTSHRLHGDFRLLLNLDRHRPPISIFSEREDSSFSARTSSLSWPSSDPVWFSSLPCDPRDGWTEFEYLDCSADANFCPAELPLFPSVKWEECGVTQMR